MDVKTSQGKFSLRRRGRNLGEQMRSSVCVCARVPLRSGSLKNTKALQPSCSDPRAQPNPVGGSEPKDRGRSAEAINQIPLVVVLLKFCFQKCRDPNP